MISLTEKNIELVHSMIKSGYTPLEISEYFEARAEANQKDNNETFEIVIHLKSDDDRSRRIALPFSKLLITTGCLMVVDPVNEVPCEVHCYSMSAIEKFIFDNKALTVGAVEFRK